MVWLFFCFSGMLWIITAAHPVTDEHPDPLPASCHVFGNNIITFDRLHYAIDLNGSYILAQDALHNFTVVLHKEKGDITKTIIEVFIANDSYKLLPNNVLLVSGTRVKIPYKSSVVNVTLWEPSCDKSYIRLTSQIGVEINYKPEAVEVSVDGFYYRRMRALCGNNDNMVNEEWDMPNNETSEEYFERWMIQGKKSSNSLKTDYKENTYIICKQAFTSKTMKPVSHEVDLLQFYQACLVEVENRQPTESQWMAVCRSIEGVKVAAFTRDFPSPLGCLYGEWQVWKTDPDNPKLEFRMRKLRGSCDMCCPRREKQYRNATDNLVAPKPSRSDGPFTNAVVGGWIGSNGAVKLAIPPGSFTTLALSTGLFHIIFTPTLASTPVCSVTQVYPLSFQWAGNTLDNAVIMNVSQSILAYVTGDSNGNRSNRNAMFTCMTPMARSNNL